MPPELIDKLMVIKCAIGWMARETQPLWLASDGIFTLLLPLGSILCGLLNVLRNVGIAYDGFSLSVLTLMYTQTYTHMFKVLISTLPFNIAG